MRFKEGDYVRIVDREVTPADTKGGMYYPYFRGLAGVVDKIYDKEICVRVDTESLPEGILKRHLDVQESIKKKWLNGLSGEARTRLTPEEKAFQLSYTILVQETDLEKTKPGEGTKPIAAKRPAPSAAEPAPTKAEAAKPVEAPKPAPTPKAVMPAPEPKPKPVKTEPAPKAAPKPDPDKPLSSKDLEALEQAHFEEIQKSLKGKK